MPRLDEQGRALGAQMVLVRSAEQDRRLDLGLPALHILRPCLDEDDAADGHRLLEGDLDFCSHGRLAGKHWEAGSSHAFVQKGQQEPAVHHSRVPGDFRSKVVSRHQGPDRIAKQDVWRTGYLVGAGKTREDHLVGNVLWLELQQCAGLSDGVRDVGKLEFLDRGRLLDLSEQRTLCVTGGFVPRVPIGVCLWLFVLDGRFWHGHGDHGIGSVWNCVRHLLGGNLFLSGGWRWDFWRHLDFIMPMCTYM